MTMKKTFLLLLYGWGLCMQAQYTAIPDSNFETILYTLGIDTVNGDGRVLTSRANQVTSLDVSSMHISDLTGIKNFTSLSYLNCNNNELTTLDLSGMINLTSVNCHGNHLVSINLAGMSNLVTLSCSGNLLTSLNLNGLTSLKYLYSHVNLLTSLNLNGLYSLELLYCHENQLSSINFSGNINLQEIYAPYNQLTSLNLNGLLRLQWLTCFSNQLSALNCSAAPALNSISCSSNPLTSLNLTGLTNLQLIDATECPNLSCIQVDDIDAAYNNSNWYKDASAIYSLDCETGILTAPPVASAQSFCNGATVAQLVATGSNLKWYTTSTGGTALTATTPLTVGTYYVSQTVNGTESARTSVEVTSRTSPPTANNQSFMVSGTVGQLQPNGSGYAWYRGTIGGTALLADASVVNGSYYVSFTQAGCESTRTRIAVNIVPLPSLYQCGVSLSSIFQTLYSTQVAGATGYRFEVSANGQTRTFDTSFNNLQLTQLSGTIAYNTTYSVRVAALVNGSYTAYGSACSVTTPAAPAGSDITSPACGSTLTSRWNVVRCRQVYGATAYRFSFTNGGTTLTYVSSTNSMQTHFLPGRALNTTYTVTVAAQSDGVWGAEGPACTLTMPATNARLNGATSEGEWTIKAVPNPFSSNFTLIAQGGNETPVLVHVYDMTGRLVESFSSEAHALQDVSVGENYAAGVYNLSLTQGEETQMVRVVKR